MEQSGALFSVALSAQECERTTGFADREESLARTRGSRIGSKQLAHAWPSMLIGIKPVRVIAEAAERGMARVLNRYVAIEPGEALQVGNARSGHLNNRRERLAGDRCDCSEDWVHRADTVPDNRVECSRRGRGHAGILLIRTSKAAAKWATLTIPGCGGHQNLGRPAALTSTL